MLNLTLNFAFYRSAGKNNVRVGLGTNPFATSVVIGLQISFEDLLEW